MTNRKIQNSIFWVTIFFLLTIFAVFFANNSCLSFKDVKYSRIALSPLRTLNILRSHLLKGEDNGIPPSPVNDSQFHRLEIPSICAGKAEPEMLWYIYNKPDNFERRAFIRSKYANATRFPPEKLKLVFVFGRAKGETPQMEQTIRKEATTHGDILYANFIEDYANLTFKAVVLMKYVVEKCSKIKYIVKSDDDTILNIEPIANILRLHKPNSLFITGKVYNRGSMPIIRDPNGGARKWYVSPRDYPVRSPDMYPQYCSGLGFGMTLALFKGLYKQSRVEPWLWLDDAYITGVLSEHITGIQWHVLPLDIAGYKEGLEHLQGYQNGTKVQIPMLLHYVPETRQYEELTDRLLNVTTDRL